MYALPGPGMHLDRKDLYFLFPVHDHDIVVAEQDFEIRFSLPCRDVASEDPSLFSY